MLLDLRGQPPDNPLGPNKNGRGPAWSNSLFEDNAEFGLGFRLTLDKQAEQARELVQRLSAGAIGRGIGKGDTGAPQNDEADIYEQRRRVEKLKSGICKGLESPEAENLLTLADFLVKKSVWIVGGDGWAYDIGYGGLDHVLASGRNVNILVLDTEVYSNTGGQTSKSTPRGAVAKFAAGGKGGSKKDLGMHAMNYGNVYVAQMAMGASDLQTVKAFVEAEAYDGPSLIIAYSHCIAHGINMRTAMDNQKAAVQSGHWPMYRYNPDLSRKARIRCNWTPRNQRSVCGVRLYGKPLHNADEDRSGRSKTSVESGSARRSGALDLLRTTGCHSLQPD